MRRAAVRATMVAAIATAIAMSASGARAQKPVAIPQRPALEAGADTNDAHAYYLLGTTGIYNKKPEDAVRAFYWATRLDPASGDYLYALHSAKLMAMPADQLLSYFNPFEGRRRSSEALTLDTVLFRALLAKPFLHRRLDELVMQRMIDERVKRIPSVTGRAMTDMWMQRMVRMDVVNAYSKGAFSSAAALGAEALNDTKVNKKTHDIIDSGIHADRSRFFFMIDNMDSARAEMSSAIDGRRKRDSTSNVFLYESKALYEQSLGIIYERQKNLVEARKSYELALTEDLSDYAAHARLSALQLAAGDTAAAMTEMNLAVQLVPEDPVLHYEYALALVQTRHDAEASDQLRRAIAADSYYAAPHLLLAIIANVEQFDDQALAEFQRFVALAPRTDPQEGYAKDQISKLTSKLASASSQ
jgi:tetratricopeptide (TPR) repeat protein